MLELKATSAANGLVPLSVGDTELTEIDLAEVTSIAPFKGQAAAVGAVLGHNLPKAGRSRGKAGADVVWFSQGQYLLIGMACPPELAGLAAITDQSDAWCALSLSGAGAEAVLARLVPVDVRADVFKRGHCLRSQLGHMPLHLTRTGKDTFRLMSFRSMAGSMVHDLSRAMGFVAART